MRATTKVFDDSFEDDDLKWHHDPEDRLVFPLEPTGWRIQLDDQLPRKLDIVKIDKMAWHRIIRCDGEDLVVRVIKDTGTSGSADDMADYVRSRIDCADEYVRAIVQKCDGAPHWRRGDRSRLSVEQVFMIECAMIETNKRSFDPSAAK